MFATALRFLRVILGSAENLQAGPLPLRLGLRLGATDLAEDVASAAKSPHCCPALLPSCTRYVDLGPQRREHILCSKPLSKAATLIYNWWAHTKYSNVENPAPSFIAYLLATNSTARHHNSFSSYVCLKFCSSHTPVGQRP